MREINEQCVRKIGQEIDDNVIQEIMAGGKGKVPGKYMEIIEGCLRDFVEKVYNTLKEHGYNLDITPIIFVGGGATVMKLYGNSTGANIRYIAVSYTHLDVYKRQGYGLSRLTHNLSVP